MKRKITFVLVFFILIAGLILACKSPAPEPSSTPATTSETSKPAPDQAEQKQRAIKPGEKNKPPESTPSAAPAEKVEVTLSQAGCPEEMARIDNYCIDLYPFPNKKDELALVNVTWYEAQEKCSALGKRLCKSEEWEKACRGAGDYTYPYGNTYSPKACCTEAEEPCKLGSYPDCVSSYGVYDMSGNVWEMTETEIRGGYWSKKSWCTKCTYREGILEKEDPMDASKNHRNMKQPTMGFRCCKDAVEQQ